LRDGLGSINQSSRYFAAKAPGHHATASTWMMKTERDGLVLCLFPHLYQDPPDDFGGG
jgi:hypothetical protein